MVLRAVTYARVSSDDRSKGGLNLAGQLETCRAFALKKGYSVVAELAEDERGVSGTLLESPALRQALAMAAKLEFDVLVVREMDRFARSLAKQLIVEQEFQKYGIPIEFVLETYADSPEGSFHKNIKAVIAEFERLKINERTRRGRLQKVKSGNVLVHGKPPYGYRVQERAGRSQLVLQESEANVVRMVFEWYVKGDEDHAPLSSRAIAKRLCEMGVPRPSATERHHDSWSPATIQKILRNETYAGIWHYGKSANREGKRVTHPQHRWLPVSTPVIITPEIWTRAQTKRRENISHAPRRTRNFYLLRHHITCAVCGCGMAARSEGSRLYYYCPLGRKSSGNPTRCANTAFWRAEHTDATVWNYLRDYLANPDLVKTGLEKFIEKNEETISPIRERMETIQNLLDQDRGQLKKIADLYIDGVFSKATLLQRKKKLEVRMVALASEFAELTERLQSWSCFPDQTEVLHAFTTEICERLDEADRHFEHRRKIVDFLDVKAALSNANGRRTAKLIFALGEAVLLIEQTRNGA